MDVGTPHRSLLPDLSGAVLRVLHDTARPLTGREVQRLAGAGSVGGVRKALIRLVEQGLVVEQPAGSAFLYTANRSHLAWPAVAVLMTLRRQLRDRVAATMEGWVIQPLLGGLFGSAARGDGTSDSDIDVLLVRPDMSTDAEADVWERQQDEIREVVQAATGNRVQLVVLDRQGLAALAAGREPIVAEWRRDLLVTAGSARLLDERPRSGAA